MPAWLRAWRAVSSWRAGTARWPPGSTVTVTTRSRTRSPASASSRERKRIRCIIRRSPHVADSIDLAGLVVGEVETAIGANSHVNRPPPGAAAVEPARHEVLHLPSRPAVADGDSD